MYRGGSMLLYNIEAIAKKIALDYQDVTSHIEHMGLRGTGREDSLRQNIKQLLPQKFAVGNGIITDVNGTQSKQQDFFVYDAFNSPIFLQMESSCIIPIESVYATVEVKSTLTKDTLKQSVDNIKSVKELEITVLKNSFFIPNHHNVIFGSVFAYTSDSSIETIAQNLNEYCVNMPSELQPSVICILDKGLIVNFVKEGMKEISIHPADNTAWGIIKNTEVINFYLFYLLLQQHLNLSTNFPPDLLKYAQQTHALDNVQLMVPKEMIPDDAFISLGDTNLDGAELKFLGENHQLIYKLFTNQLTIEELQRSGKTITEFTADMKRFVAIMERFMGGKSKNINVENSNKIQELNKN